MIPHATRILLLAATAGALHGGPGGGGVPQGCLTPFGQGPPDLSDEACTACGVDCDGCLSFNPSTSSSLSCEDGSSWWNSAANCVTSYNGYGFPQGTRRAHSRPSGSPPL